MHVTLWAIAGVLALALGAGGAAMLALPKDAFRSFSPAQHWVDDFGAGHIRFIGAVKVLGAVGLVVPGATGLAPVLVPVAASCLALVMAGAATTRFRRNEWVFMAGDLVFVGLLVFLAWGRFDLQPFA